MGIIPSTVVTRVHLFRHGEVVTGAERVCRGQSDVPLSEVGRAQSAAAATWFAEAYGVPDRVVSSDLSRCAEFAGMMTGNPTFTRALREQDMGAWEGRNWSALTAEDGAAVTAYWTDYVNARPTDGESYREAAERAVAWWEAQEFAGERVVIVTHIGVIRALLCHWLRIDIDQSLRWAPGYATHTSVLIAEAGVVVEVFGERVAEEKK